MGKPILDENDDTRINLKHYIGSALGKVSVIIPATFALSMAGGGIIGTSVHALLDEDPDTIGTAQQNQDFARLTTAIETLGQQKLEVAIAQKQHEIAVMQNSNTANDDAHNLKTLERQLTTASYTTLADLFNTAPAGEEASVSEAQFVELSKLFSQKVSDPSNFGFNIDQSNAAYLDECRIGMDEMRNNGNYINTALTTQQCMHQADGNAVGIGIVVGMPVGFLLLFAFLNMGEKMARWEGEDKRRPKKRRYGRKPVSKH